MNTPYHCGFFLTIWDKLFSTCYPQNKDCFCAECARYVMFFLMTFVTYSLKYFNFRKNGLRTEAEYSKISIPDYSVLFNPTFWMTADTFKIKAKE